MSGKRSSVSTISMSISGANAVGSPTKKKGLSYGLTSFFLIAQMAGAGFLALPKALSDVGWLGIPMMLLFCGSVGFAGTRLGQCWIILEERWPEYKLPTRQPYMDIAERALGNVGRKITQISVVLNLFGSTTVFIILISEMVAKIIAFECPGQCVLTKCELVIIVGAVIIPFTWLGTPKDFWQASLLAVIATAAAVVVIVIQIFEFPETRPDNPQYPNPTVGSFSLGFGSILFAFGGAAVFPTIQNDMEDRSQFWKSICLGFLGIMSLYLPVGLCGFILYGDQVESNILLTVTMNLAVEIAIGLQIINLLCTFIISSNPVSQSVEDVLNVSNKFTWKRCVLRSLIVSLQMLICLAIPDFGLILNLIGGSLITLCTFVLPPLMYMKLIDDHSGQFKKRTIPTWERIFLVEIMIVGIIGGVCSTLSALYSIIVASFSESCFTEFSKCTA
ncbi:uncharacterized protein [Procambarus clarkii]|uniref:uncharacterized protein n=1 Tax=Procambarus clarkii TaxID=6728 RepID=UPI001E676397|nr:amino acid transporter AVT1J-like [Procambarus clarkii]